MKQRIIKMAVILLVAGILIIWISDEISSFHRYPSNSEVMKHLGAASPSRIRIVSTEADIGFFEIQIDNEEPFLFETVPQWVLPGRKYDWSK